MRALFVALLALVVAGCGDKKCAPGSIFVHVERTGPAASADTLVVTIGSASQQVSLAKASADTSVELKVPYVAGQVVTVTFTAETGGSVVASTTQQITLLPSCTSFDVQLDAMTDGGVIDTDGGADGGPIDTDGGFVCGAACFVTHVTPRLAHAGDTIVIDGAFVAGTTVAFPGGVTAPLTLSGTSRGTAVVPAGTTAGALTVESGNTKLDAGTFRAASYTLAPGSLDTYAPQLEVARGQTMLDVKHKHEAMVATDGWIYVLGGSPSSDGLSSPTNTVERIRVNSDGSLGFHETMTTTPLQSARTGHAAVILGSKLWVIGGSDGTSALASAEWATINADGTLSAFTLVPNALTTARSDASVNVIGTSLYIVGGYTGTADLASVESALVAADGSLGAFTTSALTLTTARRGHSAFVTPTQLVIVGGEHGSGAFLADSEVAPITSGAPTAFAAGSATALPTAAAQLSSIQFGNQLLAWPYLSTIKADGSVGDFVNTSPMVSGQGGSQTDMRLVVARDHLYMNTTADSDQDSFNLFATGSLIHSAGPKTFTIDSNAPLPNARGGGGYVVIGNRAYVIAGHGAAALSSEVDYATIAADDSLGAFTSTGTTAVNDPRAEFGLAVLGNALYLLGGIDNGTNAPTTISYANIAADDTIGAWGTLSGATTAVQRQGVQAIALDGVVCIMGGRVPSSATSLNTFECSALGGPSGMQPLGFQLVTASGGGSQFIGTATYAYVTGQYQQSLYVMGGSSTAVESTPLDLIGTENFQTWTTESAIGVGAGRTYATGLQIGPWWYLFGGNDTPTVVRQNVATLSTPFATDSSTLVDSGLMNPGAMLIGNSVYIVGGDGSTAVERATLADD